MRTPSLRLRVTLTSLAVLVAVLLGVNAFVYVTLRRTLLHNLDDVLTTRAHLVRVEAEQVAPEELPSRLTALGIRATITGPDGRTLRADPVSPMLGNNLPPSASGLGERPAAREVLLPGGWKAVVFARRSGVEDALSNLLVFEGMGTAMALIIATLLLRRTSQVTLRPVDQMAAAARRVAAGERGQRLRPDRPTTPLGELATAYDAMLDDLEAAIDERRKGEGALAQLAAIVDSARDAILSQSLDGKILTWNHSAELMYGYKAHEAIGQPVTIVVPPGEADRRSILVDEVRKGRSTHTLETTQRCKNGTLIEVAVTISPVLDRGGAVVGVSTIARDITEQRWMARTLDDTLAALESALEQAQRSDARSRRFLADAAHQLRSPITGIRACTETLLRGAPESERDRLMMHLVREASRASRLLGGLLRLARLDQGQDLAPEPSDLVALCEGEAERTRTLAPDLEIVVDASGCPANGSNVDPGAMQEILGNLLDNARRHAAARIDLVIRGSREAMEIRVADDGPGMTTEEAERAFERFVSLDGRGGSGLGLPIAQALARSHGGDLTYEADGQKAFVLRLPLAAEADHDVVASGRSGRRP